MKIAFFDLFKDEKETYARLFEGLDVIFFEEKFNKDTLSLAKDADIISVFITSEVRRDAIDALPNLKFIATRSAGVDHIDLEYCVTRGIKVANVPAYDPQTIAEFTFALLLNLSRKISIIDSRIKTDKNFSKTGLQGFNLVGKTLGVVGSGKIGKHTVKIAKGFGMQVLAHDLVPDLDFAKANDFQYLELQELLERSDVITLHAPFNKQNYHLIDKDKISKMKKGVVIINTARGELIDTGALLEGLREGVVAGAGLDVLEGERQEEQTYNDFLSRLESIGATDKVIVTPHVAFYSKEAEENIIKTTVDNIQNFLNNNLTNIVNA